MVRGEGPSPRLVVSLIQRLPDTSMTHALMRGGPEFLGWGVDRHLQASEYDALNLNTIATGQWAKGKAPKLPEWPRPDSGEKRTPKPTKARTVRELYATMSKPHGG